LGKYNHCDGEVYDGAWVNGKKNGKGRFLFKNGDVYDGEFADDAMKGHGTRRYVNGDVYKGQWVNAQRHGFGEMTFVNGAPRYAGQWRHDEPCADFDPSIDAVTEAVVAQQPLRDKTPEPPVVMQAEEAVPSLPDPPPPSLEEASAGEEMKAEEVESLDPPAGDAPPAQAAEVEAMPVEGVAEVVMEVKPMTIDEIVADFWRGAFPPRAPMVLKTPRVRVPALSLASLPDDLASPSRTPVGTFVPSQPTSSRPTSGRPQSRERRPLSARGLARPDSVASVASTVRSFEVLPADATLRLAEAGKKGPQLMVEGSSIRPSASRPVTPRVVPLIGLPVLGDENSKGLQLSSRERPTSARDRDAGGVMRPRSSMELKRECVAVTPRQSNALNVMKVLP
jgi:hypothetical protein